jgi:putative endonuclease
MAFFTYIMASQRNGTLYTGSTDDLVSRSLQHKGKRFSGFTSKYGVDRLVWYEVFESRSAAFKRERQIKKWNRQWKLDLIEKANPGWDDLTDRLRLGDDLMDAKDWTPPREED